MSPAWFQGAISLERKEDGWQPWRLPYAQHNLFPSPENRLLNAASHATGVRLRFITDAQHLQILYDPSPSARLLDLTRGLDLLATIPLPPESEKALIGPIPPSRTPLELWLPHKAPIQIRGLAHDGRVCRPAPDSRPRWITYGSSITHCVRAHSPARTWPAIVARRFNLHLTCLGYGGQCHMDTMIALMIRDLPASVITLKLGINMMSGSCNARTFEPLVIGFVRILRERHPRIPIGLISPICSPPRETTENAVGMTLVRMREAIASAANRLRAAGDRRLYDFNGLDLFDEALIRRYSDDLVHPNADGIEHLGERFLSTVMAAMPLPHAHRRA